VADPVVLYDVDDKVAVIASAQHSMPGSTSSARSMRQAPNSASNSATSSPLKAFPPPSAGAPPSSRNSRLSPPSPGSGSSPECRCRVRPRSRQEELARHPQREELMITSCSRSGKVPLFIGTLSPSGRRTSSRSGGTPATTPETAGSARGIRRRRLDRPRRQPTIHRRAVAWLLQSERKARLCRPGRHRNAGGPTQTPYAAASTTADRQDAARRRGAAL